MNRSKINTNRRSFALLGIAVFAVVSAGRVDATRLYWTDAALYRSAADGTAIESLIGTVNARGIAIDPVNDKMYWTEAHNDRIGWADPDGDNEATFSTTAANAWDIEVDTAGGKVYWTSGGSPSWEIMRANLDGTGQEVFVTGTQFAGGLAIDPASGWIFWGRSNAGEIWKCDPNGENQQMLIDTNQSFGDIEIESNRMYWTSVNTGEVWRAYQGGQDPEVILSGLGEPIGLALDINVGKLYWTERTGQRIGIANFDGSGDSYIIQQGLNSLHDIALGPNFVDCNDNDVNDADDLLSGFSKDCNTNGTPDDCDILSGASTDLDNDGVPDECCALTPVHFLDEQFDVAAGPFDLLTCDSNSPIETGHGNWLVADLSVSCQPGAAGLVEFANGAAHLWDAGGPQVGGLWHPVPQEPTEWILTVDVRMNTVHSMNFPAGLCYVQHYNSNLFVTDSEMGWHTGWDQELVLARDNDTADTGYFLYPGPTWHTIEMIGSSTGMELRAWETGGQRPAAAQASLPGVAPAHRIFFKLHEYEFDYSLARVTFEDLDPQPGSGCCEGDVDGTGDVGVNDLLALLAAWGPNPGNPADLNGDGEVGIEDFLALLAGWGPCP